MDDDTTEMLDPRLFLLMEWLKENDESMESVREHGNRNSTYVPEQAIDTGVLND